jgi:hypothetical protein
MLSDGQPRHLHLAASWRLINVIYLKLFARRNSVLDSFILFLFYFYHVYHLIGSKQLEDILPDVQNAVSVPAATRAAAAAGARVCHLPVH